MRQVSDVITVRNPHRLKAFGGAGENRTREFRFCSTLPSQFKSSRFNDLHFALSDFCPTILQGFSRRFPSGWSVCDSISLSVGIRIWLLSPGALMRLRELFT